MVIEYGLAFLYVRNTNNNCRYIHTQTDRHTERQTRRLTDPSSPVKEMKSLAFCRSFLVIDITLENASCRNRSRRTLILTTPDTHARTRTAFQHNEFSTTEFYLFFFKFQSSIFPTCLQCFDAVGWAAGRASGLYKTEWWGDGVVICLERGADLHMAQLMPLPLTVSCFSKIRLTRVVPDKGPINGCVCVCVCVLLYIGQGPNTAWGWVGAERNCCGT